MRPDSNAVKAGSDLIKPVVAKTIAKSLAIGNPADGYYAAKGHEGKRRMGART